jgi:hypothetical protein
MKMELTESSVRSARQIQTPGNYPKEKIKHHPEYGGSLKSRNAYSSWYIYIYHDDPVGTYIYHDDPVGAYIYHDAPVGAHIYHDVLNG